MPEKTQFSNQQMLDWMGYVADLQGVTPEKIKIANLCGKKRNILALIATHKRLLIFADETHPNMLYKCWEAGYGDYEMYYGKGYEPSEMKHCKVSDKIINIYLLMVLAVHTVNEYLIIVSVQDKQFITVRKQIKAFNDAVITETITLTVETLNETSLHVKEEQSVR